jgi:hypothetical protein
MFSFVKKMIVNEFEKMVGAAGYTVCSFTTYLMFIQYIIQSIFFPFSPL